jgi:hypothetical protein
MRTFAAVMLLFLLAASVSGCATWYNRDEPSSARTSSGDPQLEYGGTFRVRAQASHGTDR